MLQVLTHNILPVFAMLALGFGAGRVGWVCQEEARTANRLAFMVFQLPLIFLLITSMDMAAVRFDAIGLYAGGEIVSATLAFAIARALKCQTDEAFLLAMCVIFVNSLLYVGPIAVLIYGETGAMPVTAIVTLDTVLTFSVFIIGMELIKGKTGLSGAFRDLGRNPVLITIAVSLAINLMGVPIAEPLEIAARFAGAAAPPLVLFVLGVFLSRYAITPTPVIVAITGLKLLGFPLLIWAGFQLLSPDNPWTDLFLLCAAGPSGAMAFSLAVLHGVRTDRIAPIIFWTSLLSITSLAWLA